MSRADPPDPGAGGEPRTLWVTNDFPPRHGGIERFLAGLLDGLDPARHLVLASPTDGWREHDRRLAYPVQRVGRRPLLPTGRLADTVRRAAADHRAEVVVAGAGVPLARLAGRLDLPVLALTHGHEAGMARAGAGPAVAACLRHAATVGVISDFTRRALRPWLPPTARVAHLPPGVDVDRFAPGRSPDAGADRPPTAVVVSRLVARKGVDRLVACWPQVRRRVPEARLIVGGDGPQAPALRRAVARAGLHDAVDLVGPVDDAALPGLLAGADAAVLPCRTRLAGLDVEGLGIALLEASACATAVVAGRSGGAPEVVDHGRTGWVVDADDPAELADAVARLLADRAMGAAMGAEARRRVVGRWAWPAVHARLRGELARLAAAGGRPHRRAGGPATA